MENNNSGDNIEDDSIKTVRSWLDKEIKITLKNKRSITGIFFCYDKQQNILLNNAYEEVKSPDSDSVPYKKELGVALVPMVHIESCILKNQIITN